MNGGHDLGGVDGLGPVVVEEDEPVFHSEWEKAALAMFSMCFRGGFFGVDQFRHGIELMHPAEYLSSRYYEHWLHTVEHHGKRTGKLDLEELDRRTQHYLEHPDEPLLETRDPELLGFVDWAVKNGVSAARPSDEPARFAVGDRVRVIDDSPLEHTRKARYVRGKTGEVTFAHGTMIYPDSAGNDKGEDPKHVYTVKFDAAELWGAEAADPNASVYFDVWEPYLEPVTGGDER
jgi:nitrile hydratase